MQTTTLEYQYTRADHDEVYRAATARVLRKRGPRIVGFVALVILILVVLWALRARFSLIVFFAGVLLGIIFMAAQAWMLNRRRYAELWRNTASFQSPMKAVITDTLLRREALNVTSEWLWPAFTNFFETASLFVLKQGTAYTVPVPKRAFANEAEANAFREFLRARFNTEEFKEF